MDVEQTKTYLRQRDRYTTEDLLLLMQLLRTPEGCPWDREQTHESIRKNLIEETYEVVEAIDNGDTALLREELGDLLLQVVFHAEMEAECGHFTYADLVNELCRKLVERHPHVFGAAVAKDGTEALSGWDAVKRKQKQQRTTAQAMDSVARTLPSLMRAQKLASKASKAADAAQAAAAADAAPYAALPPEQAEQAIGAALYRLCAVANAVGVDAEEALYRENERVIAAWKEK